MKTSFLTLNWKKDGGKLLISNREALNLFVAELKEGTEGEMEVRLAPSSDTQRSKQQNKAMHLWFQLVAEALNAAGYTIQKVLTHFKIEIDWTKDSVKEVLWKQTQKALLGKDSTTELSKHEDIDLVYNHVNRFLGEKLQIESIPFPSYENQEIQP